MGEGAVEVLDTRHDDSALVQRQQFADGVVAAHRHDTRGSFDETGGIADEIQDMQVGIGPCQRPQFLPCRIRQKRAADDHSRISACPRARKRQCQHGTQGGGDAVAAGHTNGRRC